jgi:hypothetical protein
MKRGVKAEFTVDSGQPLHELEGQPLREIPDYLTVAKQAIALGGIRIF